MKHHRKEPLLPGFENYTHEQLFFISYGNVSPVWSPICSKFNQSPLTALVRIAHGVRGQGRLG